MGSSERDRNDMQTERIDICPSCGGARTAIIDAECCLCRCDVCGLVFDNPRPIIAALSAYYSDAGKYDRWLARSAERERLWQRRLRVILRTRRNGSLLDIGAGIGQFLECARKPFSSVNGTELSASACAIALERYGISLLQGDIETIDFGNQRFDLITLFHVLEHVPRPGAFLERVGALLAPGGSVIVAVPNELFSVRARLKAVVKLMFKRLGKPRFQAYGKYGFSRISFDGRHDEVHLSHFTEATLKRALELRGFYVVRVALDPFWATRCPRSWFEQAWFFVMNTLHAATGRNWYDTIWIEARREG